VKKLKERYKNMFGNDPDITLVFDRGNNRGQMQGVLINHEKCRQKLEEYQEKLRSR